MPNSISATIDYFFHEGKENLDDCLRLSFEAAARREVRKIVIFTGIGQGPKLAIEKFCSQPCFSGIQVIAVTFPYGQHFTDSEKKPITLDISAENRELFRNNNVPIVRAHLPFDPISAYHKGHGILGQDLTLIGNALSIFCGSMSLCVQAALMACDAGLVGLGEHVIAITSDTSILVRCAPTERLLTDFIVREIICKPMSLTMAKGEKRLQTIEAPLVVETSKDLDHLLDTAESAQEE